MANFVSPFEKMGCQRCRFEVNNFKTQAKTQQTWHNICPLVQIKQEQEQNKSLQNVDKIGLFFQLSWVFCTTNNK